MKLQHRPKKKKTTSKYICYVCGKEGATIYVGGGFYRHRKKQCSPGSLTYLKVFKDTMKEDIRQAFKRRYHEDKV